MSEQPTHPGAIRADDALTRRTLLAALPLAGGALALPVMAKAEDEFVKELQGLDRTHLENFIDLLFDRQLLPAQGHPASPSDALPARTDISG